MTGSSRRLERAGVGAEVGSVCVCVPTGHEPGSVGLRVGALLAVSGAPGIGGAVGVVVGGSPDRTGR